MNSERASGPLSHLIVLDITQFLAGPYACQILGDLGARVIKIESPDGEMTHTMPPYFIKGESAYYLSVNRNKENIVVDLKQAEGRDVLLRLATRADVVVENFRPGVAARLGLSYEQLRTVNPRIVMCSISGFGQDGPYRDVPAYDIIVQALSGGMSITGEEGGKPVRTGVPLGDLAAGMYGVIGILAGIAKAARTEDGSYVDVSMLDCQVSMLSYQAAYYLISGEVPGPQGRGHRSIPTYRAFRCADGVEIVVAANTEKMWSNLCQALNVGELRNDPRFATNGDRLRHRTELDALLEPAFAALDSEGVLARLAHVEVPSAPINTLDRTVTDPQVLHRNMVVSLQDPDGDIVRVAGNPIKIAGFPSDQHAYPHKLGNDTWHVLRELTDLTDDDLSRLEQARTISACSQ